MPFYMKIDNFPGSTTAANHQGWIKLESIDFGVSRHISVQPGRVSDREAAIPKIGEFTVTKLIDKSSPKFLEASCTGISNGTAIIHACRTSEGLEEYLEYIFSDVIISNYDINGTSPEDNDEVLETLHLNFTKVQMKYVPRNAENQAGSPIICGYDLMKATKL